ncbi:MAG: sigma-70 family RNA polymerase sigma factor [Aestuariivirga sp.]
MTDKAKFERQAMVHMAASYNLAYSLLRQRSDAEDAVQDAFIRAYRAFSQLRGDDIRPWLLTIVRNVCYRRLQERNRARNVISLDEALVAQSGGAQVGDALTSKVPTPEQAIISASNQIMLNDLLAALPPAFREVIVLREIEELPYDDIAGIIGAPIGTVMSRLSRARAELRVLMEKYLDRGNSNAV